MRACMRTSLARTRARTHAHTNTPASCSVDEGLEGGMLRLGPRANLLLFTWRGVAVEVGVWLDRDLAVRPPSGGCQGHAHIHTAHHYRGMHMHTNTVHITTCCFGSCPPHCFGVSYNLNCVPAAGACTCTQARAQVCARFNPSLRAPSSFRDAGGCSHCNHSKHLAALHSRFSSSVTSRTSVTAGPASSDWPPFALPCWGSTSSFDTPGWRNRWQTAWPPPPRQRAPHARA